MASGTKAKTSAVDVQSSQVHPEVELFLLPPTFPLPHVELTVEPEAEPEP